MTVCKYPYVVFVNAYDRFRCNQWEHVSKHWRKLPNR